MVEEIQDENTVDPSTTETEQSEATEEQAVQEEQSIPYDRFKEVIDQKNQAAQEAEQWRQQAQVLTDKLSQPNAPAATKQEIDLIQKYGAQDPATREFLRELKGEMRKEAQKVGEELSAPILRENEALRRTIASIQEKQFRQENSDVKPNSPEEKEIAQYVSLGMSLDKATMAVMGTKRIEEAKKTGKVSTTKKTQQKVQANLERTSVPSDTSIPSETPSYRDEIRQKLETDWDGTL